MSVSPGGRRSRLFSRMVIYALVLAAVMAAFHIVVAVVGAGIIDQWSVLALVAAAVVIILGALMFRRELTTLPFAFFVFHVISYVLVAGSVAVHAFVANWAGTWGGGLVWMVGLWSVGLLVHAFASISHGGFADADA